jgi:predicted methyltransferase
MVAPPVVQQMTSVVRVGGPPRCKPPKGRSYEYNAGQVRHVGTSKSMLWNGKIARRNMMIGRVSTFRATLVALAAFAAVGLGASLSGAQNAPDFAALVAAPDRSDADRTADKRRDPVKILAFSGIRTGMRVLDMGAGAGYSTELMARAVGPTGTVYAQNPTDLPERPKGVFEARLKTPVMKNTTVLWRTFDDPLPADVGNLDLITFLFYYHDTAYMQVDRAMMNRKLLAALKPGASLVLADHSAKAGDGVSVARTFHRIEESLLKREVEAAGFKLVAEADFWRQPNDPRDFSPNRPTGPVDEFVLRFEKAR